MSWSFVFCLESSKVSDVLGSLTAAGLFPCIILYLMMTYRREETGRRVSYIFSCAVSLWWFGLTMQAFSGAVGGLIAYGLVHIQSGTLVGWQYLYVVEGGLSLLLAPVAFFWIPNRIDEAWYLNEEQRKLAGIRYELNKTYFNVDEKFSFKEVGKALVDWKTYATGAIQFCADVTLYGISTFM